MTYSWMTKSTQSCKRLKTPTNGAPPSQMIGAQALSGVYSLHLVLLLARSDVQTCPEVRGLVCFCAAVCEHDTDSLIKSERSEAWTVSRNTPGITGRDRLLA